MIFLEAARLVVDAGHDVEFVIASPGSRQVMLRHRAQRLQIADRVTVADYPNFSAEFWSVLDLYCQPASRAKHGSDLDPGAWSRHSLHCHRRQRTIRPDRFGRKWRAYPAIRSRPLQERSLLFLTTRRRLDDLARSHSNAFEPVSIPRSRRIGSPTSIIRPPSSVRSDGR